MPSLSLSLSVVPLKGTKRVLKGIEGILRQAIKTAKFDTLSQLLLGHLTSSNMLRFTNICRGGTPPLALSLACKFKTFAIKLKLNLSK